MADERFELKEMQKLEGHTDKVLSLAWNPVAGTNGTPAILASCSADKTVRIWKQNPETCAFKCVGTIKAHTKAVSSCCWSPDGDLLAIASFDGEVSIWNRTETGFEFWYFLDKEDENEVKSEVESVSWDACGVFVATCSRNEHVYIWRVESEDSHEILQERDTEDVKMVVQWHPTKYILFLCSYDNTIKVWPRSDWDINEWKCAQTLDHTVNGHSSTVRSISFNATGDKMVTSSDDLSIKIWGAEGMPSGVGHVPWKLLQTLSTYHDRPIFSVHWSSEGIIASGAADNAICLFEENQDGLESGAIYKLLLKKEKAHENAVNSVQWSPKEIGLLASSSNDGTIKIWKLASHQ